MVNDVNHGQLQIEIVDIAVMNAPMAAFHMGHAVFFINQSIDYRPFMGITYGCACTMTSLVIFNWNRSDWNIAKTAACAAQMLICSCWYAVETQVVIRKKHRFRFHPDDTFFLILCLGYIDVWNFVIKCSLTSDSRPQPTEVDVDQPPNIQVNTSVQLDTWSTRGIPVPEIFSVSHNRQSLIEPTSLFLIFVAIFPLPTRTDEFDIIIIIPRVRSIKNAHLFFISINLPILIQFMEHWRSISFGTINSALNEIPETLKCCAFACLAAI